MQVLEKLKNYDGKTVFFDDVKLDKAVACFLGNIIGDAFGAPTEFSDVRYGLCFSQLSLRLVLQLILFDVHIRRASVAQYCLVSTSLSVRSLVCPNQFLEV